MADNRIFKISFIGGGNMATALINGLIQQGFPASAINVVEPDAQKRAQLGSGLGVSTTEQLPSVSKSDVVVLAVKPQQLRDLSIFLGSLLHNQLVISVAAGVRTKDLSRWLGGYQSIVRVMPNTPAQIQKGISALFALPTISTLQREHAGIIFSAA